MSNNLLYNTALEQHPDVDHQILSGYSKSQVKNLVPYIIQLMTESIDEYNMSHLLKIVNIAPKPIKKIIRDNTGKRFDIAKSDLIVYDFTWTFNGATFTHPVKLPVPRGNKLSLSNSTYRVISVIREMVLSVELGKSVIVDLNKQKFKVENVDTTFVRDGELIITTVVFSTGFFKPAKGGLKIPLNLYHIIDVGLENHLGCRPIIIKHDNDNATTNDKYHVFSNNLAAKNRFSVLLKKEEFDLKDSNKVYQLLYILECLPDLTEQDLTIVFGEDTFFNMEEETELFTRAMCYLASNNKESYKFNEVAIRAHIAATPTYNEKRAFALLAKVDINVNTIQELFVTITDNYLNWITHGMPKNDKALDVNMYLAAPIISGTTELLRNLSTLNIERMSTMEMRGKITNFLREGRIFHLNKQHKSVLVQDSQINACDVYQNIVLETQNDKNAGLESKIADPKDTQLGNLNIIPLQTPIPTATLNPCALIGPNGEILYREKMYELERKMQE